LAERKQSIAALLSHLISASALPGETANPAIGSFHFNAARCFAIKLTKHSKNITWLRLNNLDIADDLEWP